jgi:hypothetical protein
MEKEIKRMDVKEFREKGYLQELNRKFLHPLGLALEVVVEQDGTEHLGGIWDYRDDPEGIYYDIEHSEEERKVRFRKNYFNIAAEFALKGADRQRTLGFDVEPIE